MRLICDTIWMFQQAFLVLRIKLSNLMWESISKAFGEMQNCWPWSWKLKS